MKDVATQTFRVESYIKLATIKTRGSVFDDW